jgi:hypothetical protein
VRRLFVLVVLAGCASVHDTSVPVLAMQAQRPARSRADVELSLRAVSYADVASDKDLLARLSWYPDASREVIGGGKAQTAVVATRPLPVFAVHLGNHGAQPLDFTGAELELVDDRGKRWPLYADLAAIGRRAWDVAVARFPALARESQAARMLGNVLFKTPCLDRRTVVPAQTDFDGWLVFELDARTPDELERYLASVHALTVEITHVGPDDASFTVPVTIGKARLLVTCPRGAPRSVAACLQRPLAP